MFSILFHPPLSKFGQSYSKGDDKIKSIGYLKESEYILWMTVFFKNISSCMTEEELVYTDGENVKIYFWCITLSRNLLSIFCVWLSVNAPSWFSICQNSFGQSYFWYLQYMHLTSVKDIVYIMHILIFDFADIYSCISSINFSSCSYKSSGKIVFNTFIVQYNMSHTIRQRQHWAEFTIYTVSSYYLFYHSLREWHLFLKMVSWP